MCRRGGLLRLLASQTSKPSSQAANAELPTLPLATQPSEVSSTPAQGQGRAVRVAASCGQAQLLPTLLMFAAAAAAHAAPGTQTHTLLTVLEQNHIACIVARDAVQLQHIAI